METTPYSINSPDDFDLLIESYGADEAIPTLVRLHWDKPSDLIDIAKRARSTRVTRDSVSTIAIFYHALGIGGGERVTRDLTALWIRMGYDVVIVTNTEPHEDDFELPEGVERITIPTFIGDMRKNYALRCKALRKTLLDRSVDLVVFAHWFSDVLAFDTLSVKTLGIPLVFLIQTSFTQFFLDTDLPSRWADIPLQYSLADGMVCLSEMDRCFWENFNRNALRTNNPFDNSWKSARPAPLSRHHIIWPARINADKYPLRVVPIMKALVKKVPDATVWMVGPADPDLARQLMSEARRCGVESHILLCGSQSESQMAEWYQKADAFLMTSKREGWSLALGEALAAGLPCVMYELPYLTLVQDNPAVIGIMQDDAESAAEALASVLLDKDRARYMGQCGRAFIDRLSRYDYETFWRSCFDSVLASSDNFSKVLDSSDVERRAPLDIETLMWRELLEAYRSHLEYMELEFSSLRAQLAAQNENAACLKTSLNETRAELDHVLGSKSFKIGLALTQFPRRILERLRGRL